MGYDSNHSAGCIPAGNETIGLTARVDSAQFPRTELLLTAVIERMVQSLRLNYASWVRCVKSAVIQMSVPTVASIDSSATCKPHHSVQHSSHKSLMWSRFFRYISAFFGIPSLACSPEWPSGSLVSISSGDAHACGVTSSGQAVCWGKDSSGQIGASNFSLRISKSNKLRPTAVYGLDSGVTSVSSGDRHTCAIPSDGSLQCWGDNLRGQLGDGTRVTKLVPRTVSELPSRATATSATRNHTCAVTADHGLFCWGSNSLGSIGDGTRVPRFQPTRATGITSGIPVISTHDSASCAITSANGVWCWGSNLRVDLDGSRARNLLVLTPIVELGQENISVTVGALHACSLTSAGGVLCWGNNQHGTLGDGSISADDVTTRAVVFESEIAAVSVGSSHTCAITTTGAALCWGSSFRGQLGDGTGTDRIVPTPVVGLDSGVSAISAGYRHTCAIRHNAEAQCWGWNQFGQLGDGTTVDRLAPVSVLGYP